MKTTIILTNSQLLHRAKFWIEQNGVEPNIAVKSENALDKV